MLGGGGGVGIDARPAAAPEPVALLNAAHQADHHHHHGLVSPSIRGFLVIIGLSMHAIFEGITVGLEQSPSDVYKLLAALASHKFVIAFCIGLELATSGVRIAVQTAYIFVFSIMTPIGKIQLGITQPNPSEPNRTQPNPTEPNLKVNHTKPN